MEPESNWVRHLSALLYVLILLVIACIVAMFVIVLGRGTIFQTFVIVCLLGIAYRLCFVYTGE